MFLIKTVFYLNYFRNKYKYSSFIIFTFNLSSWLLLKLIYSYIIRYVSYMNVKQLKLFTLLPTSFIYYYDSVGTLPV